MNIKLLKRRSSEHSLVLFPESKVDEIVLVGNTLNIYLK